MLKPNQLLICSPSTPAWELRLPKDGGAEKAGVKTTRSLVSGRQVHMGRKKRSTG